MNIDDLHRKLNLLAISAMEDEFLVVPKTQYGKAIKRVTKGLIPD